MVETTNAERSLARIVSAIRDKQAAREGFLRSLT
jgi:hypothetical protein